MKFKHYKAGTAELGITSTRRGKVCRALSVTNLNLASDNQAPISRGANPPIPKNSKLLFSTNHPSKEETAPMSFSGALKSSKTPRKRSNQIVVGSSRNSGDSSLVGEKRAWFHIGKLKQGTTKEEVEKFMENTFTGVGFSVEKLDTKGLTSSFRLMVDFVNRDKILDGSAWPRYVTVRRWRFLARRPARTSLV